MRKLILFLFVVAAVAAFGQGQGIANPIGMPLPAGCILVSGPQPACAGATLSFLGRLLLGEPDDSASAIYANGAIRSATGFRVPDGGLLTSSTLTSQIFLPIYGSGTSNVIVPGTDTVTPKAAGANLLGFNVTIVGVYCMANAATTTTYTLSDSASNAITSGTCSCNSSTAFTSCSLSGTPALASGTWPVPTVASNSAATQMNIMLVVRRPLQ